MKTLAVSDVDDDAAAPSSEDINSDEDDVVSIDRNTTGTGEIVMLAEAQSLDSAFDASRSQASDLQRWVAQCYRTPALADTLCGAHCIFARDVETQVFLLRKVGALLPARCPPLRVWLAVLRSIGTAGGTLCFLFSGSLPARGLRFVLGGVCRSTMHACILSEALCCIRDTLSALHATPSSQHHKVIEQSAARLTAALSGFVIASAVPAPFLATHFVACLSSALVEATVSLVRGRGPSVLCSVRDLISSLYAKVRLSPPVLARLQVKEAICEGEEDWTVTELAMESPGESQGTVAPLTTATTAAMVNPYRPGYESLWPIETD